MKFRRPKHLGWIITGVIIAIFIGYSLIPKPMNVEVSTVRRERLRQTIDAEAHIRFDHTYLITMPTNGSITKITLEPGDSVHKGQVITLYTPPVLDPRQRAEAVARYEAATATEREAKQTLVSLQPHLAQAERRMDRTQRLLAAGAIPKEESENAADLYTRLKSEIDAATARVSMASYNAQAAKTATVVGAGQQVVVTSPIDGVILRRYEEYQRPLAGGTALVEIGTSNSVDVVIDVLSTDAVQTKPGMKVLIDGWGGQDTLLATVRMIEPAARTKVSALGVEEQRVNVIARLPEPPASLGDDYKVDAHVILAELDHVLVVPLSALAKEKGEWYVFVVVNEKAMKRKVTLGKRAALTTEITQGVQEGEVIVLHPPEQLQDGGPVKANTPNT